jgi:hypothetical protein
VGGFYRRFVTLPVLCLFAMEATTNGRKKRRGAAILVLVMAIPPFVNSLSNPHLAGLRGPDILQLISIGLCVGVAFGLFVGGRASS